MSARISAFELEVLKSAFETIADELAIIVMRTSCSSIVRDAIDYSTAICDAAGRTLAQGLTNPGHLGSFFDAMRHVLRQYEGSLHPGDVFIGNDPYIGALHQNDVQMVAPIFSGGEIVAWAGVEAHETDVGGMDFASWSPDRKSTRLNSSHSQQSRMPSSA